MLNPVLVYCGTLNGTTPIFADISVGVSGGYAGAVQVTLGPASTYSLHGHFLTSPSVTGSALPTRDGHVYGPGVVCTLALPEALALVAADPTSAITAYL